jgi:hypothetical protein
MRWWRPCKAVQRVVHKSSRGPVGNVRQPNGHGRKNCTGEGYAFQGARSNFEITLSIAARTAGHVRLISRRYFGRRWRHDGFGSCREHGNRDGDHTD